MQAALIRLLLRLNGWRLWVLFSLGAVLSTELITSLMDLLLKGEITADYMLTGLVAAGLVAPPTLFLLSYALRELSRSQQEALAHSVDSAEVRLKVALDSSDEGILMVARDGKVLSANKRFLELWRVPPELAAAGQDEPLLAHVLDQLADPDGFMGQVRRLYGSDEEAKDTLQFKDGRVFARYTRALSLGREQGRIWCFKDTTDQAHTQAALAEREELYRAIVSQAGDGIDLVDAETLRFVEVNEAACRMLGYRREELVQQPMSMIQADLTEAALREVVAGILQSGHGSFEARHCCKDGRILDVHTNVRVIRLQGRDFLACIWRDISERIAAERAMQQLNADLDATLQAIPDLLFEMSGSGEYIRVWARNPELLAAHGEALLGHTVGEILPPEAASTVMSALRDAEKNGYSRGQVIRLSLPRGDSWFELSISIKTGTDPTRNRFIVLSRDITERKRIEQRLNMAIEVTQVVLWEVDFLNDRLMFDQGMLPMLGLEPDELLDSLQAWIERVHPDDLSQFMQRFQLAMQPGNSIFDFEYRLKSKNGTYQWIHTKGSVIQRSKDGQPELAVGTSMNIMVRKQIDEAVRNSEERSRNLATLLRLMADNVPDMIWAKDMDKRYLFANKAFCEQLLNATDTDEPLGKTDMFFALRERSSRPDDPAWHTFGELCQESDAVTLERGAESVFEEFGNIKGRLTYLDVHKAPFLNERGEVIGTVGSARDITERKQLDAELEHHRRHLEELVQKRTAELVATEARAGRILESTADGLYGVDAESRINFINPAACRMFGYTAEQVIGRAAHALFHHSRPDGSPYPAEECLARQAWKAGRESRVDNETYWHADGHAIPVALASHSIVEKGEIIGAVVSIVDMSVQHAAAQAREQALIAAENLARLRSEFLANMSHEIRTPMNGVLGFAHIGLRNHQDSGKARNAFEKILASGDRLVAVVNEILDFSKIEAGQMQIDAVEMDLVDTLDQSLALVADRARAKGLELRLDKAPELPATCVSDPLRIGQVLLNLLTNAVKFTEAGRIVLSATRQGDQLVFRVTDSGIGMDQEQLRYVFNPFQQADGSITRQFGGTGLGLAISKRIVELMQGDIKVESTPGGGSRFEFRVPYAPALAAAGRAAHAAGVALPDKPLAGLSILVAEDDETNQLVLEVNLLEDGARLVMVGNGLEAVERVISDGADAYDIVLMDVQMPVMGGYEATRRIRELAPGLPIIGQTANAFAEDRDKCLAAGMAAHIAKPIDPQALVKLVLQLVEARRRG